MFLNLQISTVETMLELWDATRMSGKWVNYSHRPTQTKQQVNYYIVRALLVHGRTMNKYKLIRLTTDRTWGKTTTFPFIVFYVLGHGSCTQMSFCLRTFKLGIPKFPKFSKLVFPQLWKPIISY
jgi:hypothetical protein